MSIAMLRASGPQFDVDTFLGTFSQIPVDNVWRRGETARHGRIKSESGFSSLIAESENTSEVVNAVTRFSKQVSRLITKLADSGASSVIDISLEVGSEAHFTSSIRFDPDLLRQLGELGVELQISGYPVSDE